jgi:hypothetical protein
MPHYRAYGSVVGSKYLGEFEAATPEEAKEMACSSGAASIDLCHHCADECSDGMVEKVFVEEIEPEPKPKGRKKRKAPDA